MGSKVKITKRDMKEDKFTTSMILAKNWLEEHWQIVAIIAAIIAVVIIGAVYMSKMQEGKRLEGIEKLTSAITKLRQLNYQEAILDFNAIVDDNSGDVAATAQFYLANAHYESRNYDEAMNNYEKYINKYHHDKLMTASAYAGIGACLENKQEYLTAGDKYLQAVNYYPKSASAADYYLAAVRNYVLAKDAGKAEIAYEQMGENFKNTDYYNIATRHIMTLRIK
ncbi:MAG: tetratricopeptide repeat protein [Candidatus Zixiibacteriota bacterium]